MELPGVGAPIVQRSGLPTEGRTGNWREIALPITVRERVIIAVIAALKDKPDWERKVFDENVVAKWRSEALAGNNTAQRRGEANKTDACEYDQAQQTEPRDTTLPKRQMVITENLFQYVSLMVYLHM